jgi:mRNA-degrading endonuclease RelE of RelBE toxin-antitoxin system
MDALFIELPPFQRYRSDYLDDEGFAILQAELMRFPQAGPVIQGTGGLRKLRFFDDSRQKGKRGGIRVIYYWWSGGEQFWLFTVYGKDQQDDLSTPQRKILKHRLDQEIAARYRNET